jgi:uncharacterized protein YeaO (DUF488 family)
VIKLTESEIKTLKKELHRREKLGHTAAVEMIKEKLVDLGKNDISDEKQLLNCYICSLLEKKEIIDFFGKKQNIGFCPVFKEKITLDEIPTRHGIYKDFYFVTIHVYNCPNHPNYKPYLISQSNEKKEDKLKNNIRLDCYISVFKKFKEEYPGAHFELITRKHIEMDYNVYSNYLAPSSDLLKELKSTKMSFENYVEKFIIEIRSSEKAKTRIDILRKAALRGKTIFLICFEKDSNECHRSIIKKFITGEIEL